MNNQKECIIQAAIRAVRLHGMDGVRMQHIGKLANTTPSNIYPYFKGKEELLRSCFEYVDHEIARIFDTVQVDPQLLKSDLEGEVCKMWTAYWRWFMDHPDETVFYHLFRDWSGFPEYERRRDTSHFASYIQSIKLIAAQCPNLCSIPVDLFCLYVLNMTIMSAKLVAQGTLENSKETESAVFALIMHGLAGLLAGT
ncbi:MAG: TetR/AcrR family transcriptional regulator [Lawsonibacter sp.]|nr:TetR/AcrR family transcriptional regulator [Lawsonibacter sp.]